MLNPNPSKGFFEVALYTAHPFRLKWTPGVDLTRVGLFYRAAGLRTRWCK